MPEIFFAIGPDDFGVLDTETGRSRFVCGVRRARAAVTVARTGKLSGPVTGASPARRAIANIGGRAADLAGDAISGPFGADTFVFAMDHRADPAA